jgi:hypothetical protein
MGDLPRRIETWPEAIMMAVRDSEYKIRVRLRKKEKEV